MTPPVRLIATDLDGTLLRGDHTVSAYTLDVLERARAAGVPVVPITARSPDGIDRVAEGAGLRGTAIIANGCLVYDLDAREIVSAVSLPVAVARKVAEALREAIPEAAFAVLAGRRVHREAHYRHATHVHRDPVIVDELARLWEAPLVVRLQANSEVTPTEEMMVIAAGLGLSGVKFTHSGDDTMMEIVPDGVSKASALAEFCAGRGIAPEEVAAFGDNLNDLEMLAWAGRPYAMANAHPAVLAAVPGRAPSNVDDGVARVVAGLLGL
ncbi:HAD family hydrolase [Actinorhabdospora filicis]|uniref:HAD family hydrolase n=1 Tax=Actinorhabdospora filicis TaxID=1785913 RepID=UPI0025539EE3|nr:HAD family hydrolase [Actinorhabdospora filicis]